MLRASPIVKCTDTSQFGFAVIVTVAAYTVAGVTATVTFAMLLA